MIPGEYIVRLRASATLHQDAAGRFTIRFGRHRLAISTLYVGVAAALQSLPHSRTTSAELADSVSAADGPESVPVLYYWLDRLRQLGALEYLVNLSGGFHVHVRPQFAGFNFRAARYQPDVVYKLSRFAFMRPAAEGLLLESPLLGAALWSGSPAFALALMRSAQGNTTDQIVIEELLLRAGYFEDEHQSDAVHLWHFHELLFHYRSSLQRLGEPFGAQTPHRQPEPPAFPLPLSDRIKLARPDLARLSREDPPFAWVVENRRSWAAPAPAPVTVSQLAEFLYRTAHPQTGLKRALPSAGSRHALEFYVLVHRCHSLAPGAYHYEAAGHALEPLPAPPGLSDRIIDRAASSWAKGKFRPDLVIVVSARLPRMASRYASIAYRNVLLDTGVALHAMYLAATAMHLAPCALGLNVPEHFQRLTGKNQFEETSIALFALSAQPNQTEPRP